MSHAEPKTVSTNVADIKPTAFFWAMLAALTLSFLLGMIALTWSDYRRTVDNEKQQISHFAELFEQAVEGSFSLANSRMSQFIDIVGTERLGTTASLVARYGELLNATLESIPQIGTLVMIDLDGDVIWSSAPSLIGQNLSDRAYFQNAKKLADGAYTVGIPITSRVTGQRVTPIAWPLRNEIGTLHGVVAASLGEEYFSKLLTLNGVGPGMHVEITAANGEAAFISENTNVGKNAAMISASQPVPALDLNINVRRSLSSVMRGYWLRTAIFGSIASGLFSIIILAAIRARRQSLHLVKAFQSAEKDRNKAQLAQREFDTIFENVGDGIVIFDNASALYRSNRRARELLDAKDDTAAVQALSARLPALSDMRGNSAMHVLEMPIEDANGIPQTVRCRVMKMQLHGDDIAYCVLEDISAEQRLSATRTAFVTSVNHELRTPLTSLAGALEVMQDRFTDVLPSGGQKLLSMASRNAERLLVLVNDILTLQAIDQQQLRFSTEKVSVEEALADAAETNSAYGLSRGVSLEVHCPDNAENLHIQVDQIRLQQVFSNLISNAMKYSPAGGTVTIGADSTYDDVIFYVRDTGPGIPKAGREKVFDRFAADVHSSEIQATGTGLGLAITRELVSRQSGELTLESRSLEDGEANPGTTFSVRFPKDDATHTTQEATA